MNRRRVPIPTLGQANTTRGATPSIRVQSASGGQRYIRPCDPSDICNAMGTLADILSVLRRERARLFAKYGLKSMAVFGSATREDFTSESDVDIMVEFDRPIGMDFFDLEQDLARIVSRKVDLVMRTAVTPHYMEFIQKDLKYV